MKQLLIFTLLCVGLFPALAQDTPGNPDSVSPEEATFSFREPVLGDPPSPMYVVYLTNCEIISSSTGAAGISGKIATPGGDYYFSNTVGQASAIGTFSDGSYAIRQGFQQPVNSKSDFRPSQKTSLPFIVYPNPFKQAVSISFKGQVEGDINISLYDNTGRLVISQQHPGSPLIFIPMGNLFDGVYIMRINIGDRSYRIQLIKQYR